MSGKANCCCPARVQHSVLCPGDGGQPHRGSHNTSYAARAVLVFWDGPILVFVARTGVRTCRCALGAAGARWCGVGGQVDAAVGAEVVAAGEGFSADETVSDTRGPTSGSLALIACPRPSSGDAGEGLVAAASALRSSLLLFGRLEQRSLSLLMERVAASQLEFVVPEALRCGGCSYPRE
jgi:hypothetical protein